MKPIEDIFAESSLLHLRMGSRIAVELRDCLLKEADAAVPSLGQLAGKW